MQASGGQWPGSVAHMRDYVAGQLAPSVALAALREGGVTITRQELLTKVKAGGIARREPAEAAQVDKYEAARTTGKTNIAQAIAAAKLPPDHSDVILLTQAWKRIGETLLKGITYNDIFAAEAAVAELATEMECALVRVRAMAC